MREIELRVSKSCDFKRAEALIERIVAERGLIVGLKSALAGYPGSIHWHFKKPKQKGTLEITLYPKDRRIWAQVQDGRKAEWIDQELPPLIRMIETELWRRSSQERA